jgi:hypothetical protein
MQPYLLGRYIGRQKGFLWRRYRCPVESSSSCWCIKSNEIFYRGSVNPEDGNTGVSSRDLYVHHIFRIVAAKDRPSDLIMMCVTTGYDTRVWHKFGA